MSANVIELARLAGFEPDSASTEWHRRIHNFFALVSAHEREQCAKACERVRMVKGGEVFAEVIRARGE